MNLGSVTLPFILCLGCAAHVQNLDRQGDADGVSRFSKDILQKAVLRSDHIGGKA